MVTVSDDMVAVEADLVAGRVSCSGCGDRLRRWGWARVRLIREGFGDRCRWRRYRPRRARCAGCGATHVLLGVSLAARRADPVVVIAAALEAKVAGGQGHRPIAARLGRPVTTVRGWLRGFAAAAGAITEVVMALVLRDAPDAAAVWPSPSQHTPARALGALGAYAETVGQRLRLRLGVGALTWASAGIAVTGGWLFSAAWWAGRGQHEPALTPASAGAGGSR